MAYVLFNKTLSEEIKLPTPWTYYRKLLVEVTQHLRVTEREKTFKLFSYRCIPSKCLSCDLEDWLIQLEQSEIINMNHLEILDYFLESFCDSYKIRSAIREFQYRLHLVQGLLGSNAQLEGK